MSINSKDSEGKEVFIGSYIKVLEIDPRITEFLPEDEVRDLNSFIGQVFEVKKINSDGSMLVSKEWHEEGLGVMGHDLAIFPRGSLLVNN
ncbi:hypothetical protein [Marinobacter nauticus]|uniref:hypothetical protein n=1 Tax=Marinobacter nauticus TaxID=2743 RepID=UPI001C99D59A|nr:hypothetical protein [Marinobacter nauticus]MBY5939226.1 hypothetical protein [Marinobacter nauticus]MBY5956420.1 hypothetical protein [Marinobacter nauticus]MBY6010211.1 hypothetical protein [Marinobacter nauticus]